MEAMEAILTRRSTRKMKPDPLPRELIEQVIGAGRAAPSGSNSQTTHFLVITDRNVLSELADLVQRAFAGLEIGPDAYVSLRHAVSAAKKGGYVFHYGAPVLIVMANRKGYGNALADSACALENMMIAANALDLGSCYINQLRWLNEDEGLLKYLQTLGLKENERVYGALALGRPATPDGLPKRQPTVITGNVVTYI